MILFITEELLYIKKIGLIDNLSKGVFYLIYKIGRDIRIYFFINKY